MVASFRDKVENRAAVSSPLSSHEVQDSGAPLNTSWQNFFGPGDNRPKMQLNMQKITLYLPLRDRPRAYEITAATELDLISFEPVKRLPNQLNSTTGCRTLPIR